MNQHICRRLTKLSIYITKTIIPRRAFSSRKIQDHRGQQSVPPIVATAPPLPPPPPTSASNEEPLFEPSFKGEHTAKATLLDNNDHNTLNEAKLLVTDSRIKQYAKLSKIRLTGFVTLTTLTSSYIACDSFLGSFPIIGITAFGTLLCSSSAAALNQFLETPFDSQMKRTAARPIVIGQVSPLETVIFATITGLTGVTLLATCVNYLTAILGASNLLLYSFVYTPLKRSNVANTWIGSIVGSIPPLMGTTAILGYVDFNAAMLAAILFSWQFPHFNALSWNLRHEYARAGYRMMSVVDPDLCKRVALRHSNLLFLYTCLLPVYGSTSYLFTLIALPLNVQFIRLSYLFYKQADSSSSRKLFRFSLIYLPSILVLLLLTQKQGQALV